MVSIPERRFVCWSDMAGGLGVVGLDGTGVADLETPPFSLLSLGSELNSAGCAREKLMISDFSEPTC
jgi:hypothetical protein